MWHILPLRSITISAFVTGVQKNGSFRCFLFPQFKCALSRSIRVGLMGNRWPFRAGFELLSVVIRSDGLVCDYVSLCSIFRYVLLCS